MVLEREKERKTPNRDVQPVVWRARCAQNSLGPPSLLMLAELSCSLIMMRSSVWQLSSVVCSLLVLLPARCFSEALGSCTFAFAVLHDLVCYPCLCEPQACVWHVLSCELHLPATSLKNMVSSVARGSDDLLLWMPMPNPKSASLLLFVPVFCCCTLVCLSRFSVLFDRLIQ